MALSEAPQASQAGAGNPSSFRADQGDVLKRSRDGEHVLGLGIFYAILALAETEPLACAPRRCSRGGAYCRGDTVWTSQTAST